MSIGRIIAWILLAIATIVLLYLTFPLHEGFDATNPETILKTDVTNFMTLANDTLCPCYEQLLDQMIDDSLPDSQKALPKSEQDPDQRRKAKAKAIHDLAQATVPVIRGFGNIKLPGLPAIDPNKVDSLVFSPQVTGLLFSCPSPTDPLQVPNNIGDYIKATTAVFLPKVNNIINNIEKSLTCPPKEGFFEKIDLSRTIETFTNQEAFDDVNNNPALQQQRIQALQKKIESLKGSIQTSIFIELDAKFKKLKDLKTRAESGQGSSNCSS